jgi:hypothetical protein
MCKLAEAVSFSPSPLNRVTRFGELSPIGTLFSLGRSLKIAEVVQIFGPLFSTDSVYFDKIRVGAQFGRFFAQTHPVTLPSSEIFQLGDASSQGCQMVLFSNQKSKFGLILECIAMKYVGKL